MIDTEPTLFDLPFFGMSHAGYEGPLEDTPRQVRDDSRVEFKFDRGQLQRQARVAPVQGNVFKESGHE